MDDHSFAAETRDILGLPKKGETVNDNHLNNDTALDRLRECVDLATSGSLPSSRSALATPQSERLREEDFDLARQPSALAVMEVMKDRVISYFRERVREMNERNQALSEDGAVEIIEDGFGLETPDDTPASPLAAPRETQQWPEQFPDTR